MAAKLEAVVSNRVRNRLMEREVGFGGDCLVERSGPCIGGIEDVEELGIVLKAIFSNLNAALGGTDTTEFESMICSRNRAKKLTSTSW